MTLLADSVAMIAVDHLFARSERLRTSVQRPQLVPCKSMGIGLCCSWAMSHTNCSLSGLTWVHVGRSQDAQGQVQHRDILHCVSKSRPMRWQAKRQ